VRRLLVIATAPIDDAVLREEVRQHAGSEEAEIHVVAPAARLSRLRWLASDEDEARAKATEVAREMEQALEETGSVDAEVGDPDPIQAIEDALRLFPPTSCSWSPAPVQRRACSRKERRKRPSSALDFRLLV
jgi:hypothetical protein